MLLSEVQLKKVLLSIFVTDSGIVILSSEVQPEKALHPISVTDSGIFTFLSEMQLLKVLSSIFVTDSGRMIFLSDVQPVKALSPISFMPLRHHNAFKRCALMESIRPNLCYRIGNCNTFEREISSEKPLSNLCCSLGNNGDAILNLKFCHNITQYNYISIIYSHHIGQNVFQQMI